MYVLVVALPFSGLFWARGFTDMRQQSWLEGHMAAFEMFGGVPRMLVPDNLKCGSAHLRFNGAPSVMRSSRA